MSFHFDFYIIHPSAAIVKNQAELFETINQLLVMDSSAFFLIESRENLVGNRLLERPYFRFLCNMEKLVNIFSDKIRMISGESVFKYAENLISKRKSICFVNFPYPELRSFYMQIKESIVSKYAVLNFSDKSDDRVFDLAQCDGKLAYKNTEKVEYLPIYKMSELSEVENVYLFEKTFASKLYLCQDGGQKKIIKTLLTDFTSDYFCKIDDLICVRKWFQRAGILEALPQKVIMTGEQKRGILCNYIEGVSLEKLYYDNFYKTFLLQNHHQAGIHNRIYIAVQLCKTVLIYHSVGIYFSDVKGDNFIVTKNCEVIPIDCDGFSYYKYYSSCPRKEMIPNPKKNRKKAFLQNAQFENYAIMVMLYRFLMVGNLPFDEEEEEYSIYNIQNRSKVLYKTERGIALIKRWFELPEYLRNILYEGITQNGSSNIEDLQKGFMRYHAELIENEAALNLKGEVYVG